jgi:hypothetical protein
MDEGKAPPGTSRMATSTGGHRASPAAAPVHGTSFTVNLQPRESGLLSIALASTSQDAI